MLIVDEPKLACAQEQPLTGQPRVPISLPKTLPAQPCGPRCSRVLSCCAAFLGLSSAACSSSASRLPHCLSSDTAVLGPMPDTPGTLSAGPGQGRERRDGSAGQARQAACHARAGAEGGARKAAPCEEGEPAAQQP